jgi:DNA-binding CsgD family transcriptional regulator
VRPLSPRERQVLELIAADKSDREIADAIQVAYQTVRGYVKTIYRKLGVHTRVGAALAWMQSNSAN